MTKSALELAFSYLCFMHRLVTTSLLFAIAINSFGQVKINGEVKDTNGNNIPFAHVTTTDSKFGTVSNVNGEFSLLRKEKSVYPA